MKAEEPESRVPVVKYGMGAEDQTRIVDRHFQIAREQDLLAGHVFASALQQLPALKMALERIAGKPLAAPVVAVPAKSAPRAEPPPRSLRQLLGLT